jgi:putative ABC transport system permease protein
LFILLNSSNSTVICFDTDYINEIDGVVTSTATVSKQITVEFEEFSSINNLVGVEFDKYGDLYSTFSAELGVIPESPSENDVVVGYALHNPWDNGTILAGIGDTINVYYSIRNGTKLVPINKTLTVVGIIEEIGTFSLGLSDTGMYISLESAMDYFDSEEVSQIVVKVTNDDSDFIDSVSGEIENLFLNEVTVRSPTAMLSTITSALATVELLLAGIAGISLLVAGIGIMNIMIVTLMERTREIGILKALGAKGRNVLVIFLAEALIIGLIGGILGIVVGGFLANVFGGTMNGFGPGAQIRPAAGMMITPVVTPTLAIEALLFGIMVSVIFALYPAWRASKLMPVDALRSE